MNPDTCVLYDPPSGWRYGFPRTYSPLPGEAGEDTLKRDGYPAKDAAFGARYCRFIGTQEALDARFPPTPQPPQWDFEADVNDAKPA